MKIHLNIAGGYKRGELKQWFEKNPDTSTDQSERTTAIRDWVVSRYGAWLTQYEITEYDIYEVTDEHFRIDFLHDTDAQLFASSLGGQVVGEE